MKRISPKRKKAREEKGFRCIHCGAWVSFEALGTKHRNHCPFCLWSKHVDREKPGDRNSTCQGKMKPIGLTFKRETPDRYHPESRGELMVIHQCTKCGEVKINRLAGDDLPEAVLNVFELSVRLDPAMRERLKRKGINPLTERDEDEVKTQLYGKKI